ncbi:hypothetical protein NMG60_11008847 [Bertholletia excelsa]
MAGGRFRELLRKYGKVALGVHFSVSGASITGLYIAIKNNVDVEAMLEKVGMGGVSKEEPPNSEKLPQSGSEVTDGFVMEEARGDRETERNRTAEMALSSGGAFALALLLNKALLPIRVPITVALTPPVARFLRQRAMRNRV